MENPILLGVQDAPIQSQTVGDNVLFGEARWLCQPSQDQQRCRICGGPLVVLIQNGQMTQFIAIQDFFGASVWITETRVCAGHPSHIDQERKLLVLACATHADQAAGWRVIRQIKKFETKSKTVTTTDWGGGDDDDDEWGDDDDEWDITEAVDKMAIKEDKIESTVRSLKQGYYVNVIEDTTTEDMSYENELLRRYEEKDGAMEAEGSGGGGVKITEEEDDEEDEYEGVNEFLECCRRQPKQLLRYQLHGRPLTLENQYAQGQLVPPCQVCGSQRAFELQLMPYLAQLSGFSFGTVQVFTCLADCCREVDSIEEFVLLQHEPDAKMFK